MEMTYYIEKDREIHFITPYNQEFIYSVKEIEGRKYDMENKHWFVQITVQNIESIKSLLEKFSFVKQDNSQDLPVFNINPNDKEDPSYKQSLIALKQKIESKKLKQIPRPYQLESIHYMIDSKRAINGSDMGTGKTFSAIFTVEVEDMFPCLVVTPSSIKYNWLKQWKRVNPKRKVSVIDEDCLDFSADVVIINYDRLGKKDKETEKIVVKYPELLKDWDSVICDESQAVKNGKSNRAKALKQIVKGVEYVFFLTGTAILNRPQELISPTEILGKFNILFGNWRTYVYRYCNAQQTRYGLDISGASNTKELNDIIKQNSYTRVEKRDVLKDLPPIEETVFEVDLENEKEYRAAEKDLIKYLKETYSQEKADKAEAAQHLVLVNTLRQLAVKGKIDAIVEFINLFLESTDKKLLVFGVYKESLKIVSEVFKCDIITGETKSVDRQKIVDGFQKNKKRVLVGNIQALGTGIDGLQEVCSTILFIELPFRYPDVSQSVSRLERDGQKDNISVNYLLAKDSIDEVIWEMLAEKRKVTDAVNQGREEAETDNIMKAILKIYRGK